MIPIYFLMLIHTLQPQVFAESRSSSQVFKVESGARLTLTAVTSDLRHYIDVELTPKNILRIPVGSNPTFFKVFYKDSNGLFNYVSGNSGQLNRNQINLQKTLYFLEYYFENYRKHQHSIPFKIYEIDCNGNPCQLKSTKCALSQPFSLSGEGYSNDQSLRAVTGDLHALDSQIQKLENEIEKIKKHNYLASAARIMKEDLVKMQFYKKHCPTTKSPPKIKYESLTAKHPKYSSKDLLVAIFRNDSGTKDPQLQYALVPIGVYSDNKWLNSSSFVNNSPDYGFHFKFYFKRKELIKLKFPMVVKISEEKDKKLEFVRPNKPKITLYTYFNGVVLGKVEYRPNQFPRHNFPTQNDKSAVEDILRKGHTVVATSKRPKNKLPNFNRTKLPKHIEKMVVDEFYRIYPNEYTCDVPKNADFGNLRSTNKPQSRKKHKVSPRAFKSNYNEDYFVSIQQTQLKLCEPGPYQWDNYIQPHWFVLNKVKKKANLAFIEDSESSKPLEAGDFNGDGEAEWIFAYFPKATGSVEHMIKPSLWDNIKR